MERKTASGCFKKKVRKQKEARELILLQSVPNIQHFFGPKRDDAEASSSISTADESAVAIANISSTHIQDHHTHDDGTQEKVSDQDQEECRPTQEISMPTEPTTQSQSQPSCQAASATSPDQVAASSSPSPPLDLSDDDELMITGPEPEPEVSNVRPIVMLQPTATDAEDSNSWCDTVTDPALWQYPISDVGKSILIGRGAAAFQNRSGSYPASVRDRAMGGVSRSFTNSLRNSSLPNGQSVSRQWLMYSPSTGCVFCFACKLFSSKHSSFVDGFSDWKHSGRIGEHERSPEHRACLLKLHLRSKGTATIDSELLKQIDGERQYWKEVLRRVVAVVQFLGERGLAFRGDDELLESPHNGNYLGIMELLARFDPFLAEHLKKFGGKGRGSVSYLSSTICEEFIQVMGEKTKKVIANEIKEAKYFSVIVDSTPDLSHVDQLTFIFRFVNQDGHIQERFLGFEPIESHTGESLADCITAMVDSLGLDLSNCRGQSYDNASNMSGKYNGVQAHLKRKNPLIHYIPCAAHSLNLVGTNAVDCCPEAGNFFDFVQSIYSFSSSSTHRWGKVFRNTNVQQTLKSLSGTRWSARADSSRALQKNYAQIREALKAISDDKEEKRETRSEASALCAKLDTLEIAFMAHFWDCILERFQATSLQLQREDMDLLTATQLLSSLRDFVAAQRDQFEKFERAALNVSTSVTKDFRQCRLKRKARDDESPVPGVVLNGRDKFRVETFYEIISKLGSCLTDRLEAYTHLTELFGVLFMSNNILGNSDLTSQANALAAAYPQDLDMSLADELIQFRSFILDKTCPAKMLQNMMDLDLQSTFPNVFVALRLFLTLPITNCEGERSFSKLARIKNELRARMCQPRLNALSLMAIESKLVRQLDFDDVVDDFARRKSRKVLL